MHMIRPRSTSTSTPRRTQTKRVVTIRRHFRTRFASPWLAPPRSARLRRPAASRLAPSDLAPNLALRAAIEEHVSEFWAARRRERAEDARPPRPPPVGGGAVGASSGSGDGGDVAARDDGDGAQAAARPLVGGLLGAIMDFDEDEA